MKKTDRCILIVEDDKSIMTLILIYIERFGYETISAINAKDAIQVFSKDWDKIGLILLDDKMPNLNDGFKAAKEIREIERTRTKTNIPIISISSDKEIVDRYKKEGVEIQAQIIKPFNLDKLEKKIKELIVTISQY